MVIIKGNIPMLKHHAVKTYGAVEVKFHAFLTSVLGGGEWYASSTKRNIPTPARNYTPHCPDRNQFLY